MVGTTDELFSAIDNDARRDNGGSEEGSGGPNPRGEASTARTGRTAGGERKPAPRKRPDPRNTGRPPGRPPKQRDEYRPDYERAEPERKSYPWQGGKEKSRALPAIDRPKLSDEQVAGIAAGMANGFAMMGMMLAKGKGEHWQFQPEECQALGTAYANMMRHFPIDYERVSVVQDVVMAGVVSVGVVYPRIEYDGVSRRQAEEAEAARQRDAARAAAGAGTYSQSQPAADIAPPAMNQAAA